MIETQNLTYAEENYVKAIFKLSEKDDKPVNTNSISNRLETTAASVTDMIKKLSDKGLVNYERYKGVTLSPDGRSIATQLIRNHRLWEVFLVNKLNFRWDQVHDLAEELEHIKSTDLINRLDTFLGNPKFDPHGDPIPNKEGKFTLRNQTTLPLLLTGQTGVLVGVKEHGTEFLHYLNRLNINLGTEIKILEKLSFDDSVKVLVNDELTTVFSAQVSQNLLVKTLSK